MVEIRTSGPLRVAHFTEFEKASLSDNECRRKVIGSLQQEMEVSRIFLDGPVVRIYLSEKPSKIARAIAVAKRMALDEEAYGNPEGKKCAECVRRRKEELLRMLDELSAEPTLYRKLLSLGEKADAGKECRECSRATFLELLSQITSLFESVVDFRERDYAEIFQERRKPFFVDGIWNPPPKGSRLIDEYKLTDDRGLVRIWEREESPVPFYELDLPEFHLPEHELGLLYSAFHASPDEPPSRAVFASPDGAQMFTEEWYIAMLHSLRSKGQNVSSRRIHELSKIITSWLTYRLLEPFSHDDYLTDIFVHAPPELQPIMVEHERWGRLETGIYWDTPSLLSLGESIASRLGTSFDEIRPQLDAEISELGMRIFLSRDPAIWPKSAEVVIRKRRKNPWTQPLFLSRGTLTPLASSFLSNALRIGCSAFVIGEVGAAKTSQVETYIPEIGLQNRIIAFQDTQELHIREFLASGYRISDVRVQSSEHLERQIRAFLRAGQSHWLITEVRSAEALRSTLGAAVRQGSQPVIASFHARDKEDAFALVTHVMGLHPEAFKHIDLIVTTARFSTRSGIVRRIIEIAEVHKSWREAPEYSELFVDVRKMDALLSKDLLEGPRKLLAKWNSMDLTTIDLRSSIRNLRFKPPEDGGSSLVPKLCRRLGMDQEEFLARVLVEAIVKSMLLQASVKSGRGDYLELPFVTKAYSVYFSLLKKQENPLKVLEEWKRWIQKC